MSTFICPLCRHPLEIGPTRWCCAQGHSFDVSREGYVNLLPVQHKNSREPGDTAASLRARRAFLEAGHYQALRDALLDQVRQAPASRALDVGCGEGWYTQALPALVPEVIGLDIAKAAIRLAARRPADITWLVGSGVLLPLADGAADLVTSVFSPIYPAEMHRVLGPQGQVVVVTPSADHLWSLREGLFGEVRPHAPDRVLGDLEPWFELRQREEVRVTLDLEQDALRQLVQMTPYAWRATPGRRAEVESHTALTTQAVFCCMRLAKKAVQGAA